MRGAGSKSIAIPIEGRNAVAKRRMLCGAVKGRPESSKISATAIETIPEITIAKNGVLLSIVVILIFKVYVKIYFFLNDDKDQLFFINNCNFNKFSPHAN